MKLYKGFPINIPSLWDSLVKTNKRIDAIEESTKLDLAAVEDYIINKQQTVSSPTDFSIRCDNMVAFYAVKNLCSRGVPVTHVTSDFGKSYFSTARTFEELVVYESER